MSQPAATGFSSAPREYNQPSPMANRASFLRPWSVLLIVAALCFAFTLPSAAQQTTPPPLPTAEPPRNPDAEAWEIQQRKQMMKKFNLQRQEEIRKDSEKL